MATAATQIDHTRSKSVLQGLAMTAAVIAALYFGRKLLVPLAFSILFSFLLSTPLTWLERLRLPRALAVSIVFIVAMSIAGGLLWLVVNEFGSILRDWPGYQANIARKTETIKGAPGAGIQNIERTFTELEQDFAGTAAPGQAKPSDKPVPVQVVTGSTLLSSLGFAGATVAELLAQVFAVCVLTLFVLLNREQLRNRVLRLFGDRMLVVATTTIDEAATRVSRYLLFQFAVNACFGVILFIGLMLIGVPYAALWGVLVLILRFVPYVGTLIAGACPLILSLAAFDGWHKPLETFALYAAVELIISTIIEPLLYANQTGISSVAYLLSAAFWTLIWGPIGLVLSTPLTVCLVVMGRHLSPFQIVHVLLGDEPALAQDVHFYQRLLADDEDEVAGLLENALKTEPLPRVFDNLVIPALSIAEQDRHEGRLSDQHATIMYDAVRESIEIAAERHPCEGREEIGQAVACIPARDHADEIVASMLVQLVRQCGGTAVVCSDIKLLDDFVIVSALPPFAVIHARSVCKRIRAEHPKTRIVLGVWGSRTEAEVIQERLGSTVVDAVVTSLEQALQMIAGAAVPEMAAQPAAVD